MRRVLPVAVALAVLSGCTYIQRGVARTSELIGGYTTVVERTHKYVDADPELSESKKLGIKAQGEALLVLLETEELVDLDRLASQSIPVIARHDAYVQADEALSEKLKRKFLRSTFIIRKVLDVEAEREGSDS